MKFAAIIEETFREAKARKTLIGFFIFSSIIILITLLVLQNDAVQTNYKEIVRPFDEPGQRGSQAPVGLTMTALEWAWILISYMIFFITVAVGVFSTASFMTSMMEKGTIDLLLSKPVPRWMYIVGRYTGAMLIMALEVIYFLLGMWLVIGISLGEWEAKFFASLFFILLGFGGIYAVVTLVSVLTRSSWFAIIMGIAIYFVSAMLALGSWLDKLLTGEESGGVFGTISNILYYMIPPAPELSQNILYAITGESIKWTPVFLTFGLIAGYLGLSSYLFSKKEF